VAAILSGIDGHVKTILRFQLSFDFAFMAGIYPAIAALCMMARNRSAAMGLKKILFLLAALQLIAWGADIAENSFLLKWISKPEIGPEFSFYHIIVSVKWIIAIAGILLATPLLLRRWKM
jgi:hypothetical protein